MKLIILAAGEGTRLRPYTLDRPKCMVEFNNKPIIDYILDAALSEGIEDISIVSGYKEEVLKEHLKNREIKFYTNPEFNKTNMVRSLFCALNEMNDDIVISYADIIYKKEILRSVTNEENDFSVVVDRNWKELWSVRMEDPLSDAETLKINAEGNISELGKKPQSYKDIEGQYIGLLKIKKNALKKAVDFYHSLDKTKMYDGKDFNNMYMTTFIQMVIKHLMSVKPVFISGGWLEIDSVNDLKNYENAKLKI